MKTYTELMSLPTFEERFLYLQEAASHGVGDQTFGSLRFLNQTFYRSRMWRDVVRPQVIVRDDGCDIAIPSRPIANKSLVRVHHINPLTPEMLEDIDTLAYDLENLITLSHETHQALTYGAPPPQPMRIPVRTPYDHLPWIRRKD